MSLFLLFNIQGSFSSKMEFGYWRKSLSLFFYSFWYDFVIYFAKKFLKTDQLSRKFSKRKKYIKKKTFFDIIFSLLSLDAGDRLSISEPNLLGKKSFAIFQYKLEKLSLTNLTPTPPLLGGYFFFSLSPFCLCCF